jgi:hypothetical protein
MKKIFRIEHFEKGIYDFKNITEARKWAKERFGEEKRMLLFQKYTEIKQIKKSKEGEHKGMRNCSFTKEVEYN